MYVDIYEYYPQLRAGLIGLYLRHNSFTLEDNSLLPCIAFYISIIIAAIPGIVPAVRLYVFYYISCCGLQERSGDDELAQFIP